MDDAKAKNKEGMLTDDEEKIEEDKIQKLTDKKIEEIDELLDKKEKEIMSV